MSRVTHPLMTQAKWALPPRVFIWAERMRVTPRAITICDTRSRWGSCYSKGRIMLCWRLILMPEAVRDSIIIHELGHLKHFNHSRDFWDFVDQFDTQRRHHQTWLKKNTAALLAR